MLEAAFKAGKLEAPHIYGDDLGSPDETYISSQFDKPSWSTATPPPPRPSTCSPTRPTPPSPLRRRPRPEGYGEIIGGSQRVDSYDLLRARILEHNLPSPPSSGTSTSAATVPSTLRLRHGHRARRRLDLRPRPRPRTIPSPHPQPHLPIVHMTWGLCGLIFRRAELSQSRNDFLHLNRNFTRLHRIDYLGGCQIDLPSRLQVLVQCGQDIFP